MDNYYYFLYETNYKTFALIVLTSVLLLLKSKTNASFLSKLVKNIGVYLLYLQVLFIVKINTGTPSSMNDLPWWMNIFWCIVFYPLCSFVAVCAIEYMFDGETESNNSLFYTELSSEIIDNTRSGIIRRRFINCIKLAIKLFYIFLFILTLIVVVAICDVGKC